MHLVYIQPRALKVKGGPLGPKASCPSQALRAQGIGVEPAAQQGWGRKREWGRGRPQPVEARRLQGVWGGREVPAIEP